MRRTTPMLLAATITALSVCGVATANPRELANDDPDPVVPDPEPQPESRQVRRARERAQLKGRYS